MTEPVLYTEDNIRSLEWQEHIRLRPGMYIGKLGDGSSADDGIYILIKEVVDNSIDEFVMGGGKTVEISVQNGSVTVRDYGRGIPLGKLVDVVSKMNTGAKYDSKAFKKSVGLNGVGTKAVNALSSNFTVQAFRDGQSKTARFTGGILQEEGQLEATTARHGTKVVFTPDATIFHNYRFQMEYVERMVWNYVYLNPGLSIYLNGQKYFSENGLKDLLANNLSGEVMHDIIHLKGEDIEVALTHAERSQSEQGQQQAAAFVPVKPGVEALHGAKLGGVPHETAAGGVVPDEHHQDSGELRPERVTRHQAVEGRSQAHIGQHRQ